MGYLIAYLLIVLAIDLIRELVNPQADGCNASAIRRRLWSDTDFDCRSKVFGVELRRHAGRKDLTCSKYIKAKTLFRIGG